MSNAAIVRAFFSRLERGDIIGAGAYLADEFTLGEPAPEPIGKERFIELLRCLTAAFPDISYGIGMLSEIADRVALVMHIAGTNTGEIRLPFPGFTPLPPTGRTVRLPYEPVEIVLHNGRITGLTTSRLKKGGIMDLWEQLGIRLAAPRRR